MAVIEAIGIPDTHLCKQVTELVRDTEPELLFNHSSRVYYFGALTGWPIWQKRLKKVPRATYFVRSSPMRR